MGVEVPLFVGLDQSKPTKAELRFHLKPVPGADNQSLRSNAAY